MTYTNILEFIIFKRLLCYCTSSYSSIDLHFICDWWAIYGPKHTSWSLRDTQFCVYIYAQLENYTVYTNVLRIKWLLCYWRYTFSSLSQHTSSDWWAITSNMHYNFFLLQQSMHTSSSSQNHCVPLSLLDSKWLSYYPGYSFLCWK